MGFTFTFTVEADPACWTGNLSTFEERLLLPLPDYALEQLRTRFLHVVTTTKEPKKTARSVLQLAFDTEIGAVLHKILVLAPDVRTSKVCERRRYLEIDADMQLFKFLWAPALDAARERDFIPKAYLDLIETHLATGYARYRVCALAALLCVTAVYLTEAA